MIKEVNLFFHQYYELLFKSSFKIKLVNWISFFRILAFPVLMVCVYYDRWDFFKWILATAFFTDGLDGFLARKLKATSDLGAKLDSMGDDVIILAGLISMIVHFPDFILQQIELILLMIVLFTVEMVWSVIKYGKPSSLHTYLAKIAAVLQGFFFILCFFLDEPLYWLFYATAIVTTIELVEELIIIYLLPKWTTNVKGLYWVLKAKKSESS